MLPIKACTESKLENVIVAEDNKNKIQVQILLFYITDKYINNAIHYRNGEKREKQITQMVKSQNKNDNHSTWLHLQTLS